MSSARAAGVHLPWDQTPAAVRAWAERLIGPIAQAQTQPGGMSPGCAVRLRGAQGRRIFVKAVGADVNSRTPALFRHEAAVLRALPRVTYRADMRSVYDDGAWVGLALEDIEGRYPDLDDPADAGAVRMTLVRQAIELAAIRPTIDGLDDVARRWLETWRLHTVRRVQPGWLAARYAEFDAWVTSVPDRLPPDQLVHWDVCNDNLLTRPSGEVVVLDWGMSLLGPSWSDLFQLALPHADEERFDGEVAGIAAELGVGPDRATVDDVIVLFGTHLAWMAAHEPVPGIPAITAFRQRHAQRLFAAARRRVN